MIISIVDVIVSIDNFFFFSSRRRHTSFKCDWSSDVCSSDLEYIESRADALEQLGIPVECVLAGGDPGREIAAAAEREGCDLVAMSTHGHRGLQDLIRGSVANNVRHNTTVPVLLVRGTPRRLRPS